MTRLLNFIGRHFAETFLLVTGTLLVLWGLFPPVNAPTVFLGMGTLGLGLAMSIFELVVHRKRQRHVQNMIDNFALLKVEEVAEFTDLTSDEVIEKAMTGEIRGTQLFGEWYFQGDRVMEYREKKEARK